MRRLLTSFCFLLSSSSAFAAGGVQTALTVSSGTFQSVDMYSNTNGANRQAIVIGDFTSSDTARVNQGQGLQVYLGTSSANGIGTLTGITNTVNTSDSQSGTWTTQIGNTQNTTPIQTISTNTVLGTGTNSIGSISNSGFNVNNSPTVQPGNTQNSTAWLFVSSSTILGTGANAIGSITNTGFNVNNSPAVTSAATNLMTVTPGTGTFPISGSITTTPGPISIVGVSGSTTSIGYQTGLSSVPVNVLNTVPVTGTFFQGTQPVSFVATNGVTVTPGSGTFTVNGSGVTQPVSFGAAQIATVTPGSGTFPVSGTFFQGTQPVSFGATQIATITPGSGTFTVNGSGVTQPVSFGATQIATVTPGSGTFTVSGTVTANPGNTQNTTSWLTVSTNTQVQGMTASGSANANNPVKIGVVASSNVIAGVNDTQITNLIGTRMGAALATLDCPRENIVQATATLTTNTNEIVFLSSGAASVFNDVLEVLAVNTSATASRLDFRSGGNGTTINFALYVPAGDTRGFTTPHPWPQTLSAANWTIQGSASITDLRVYGIFCKEK